MKPAVCNPQSTMAVQMVGMAQPVIPIAGFDKTLSGPVPSGL